MAETKKINGYDIKDYELDSLQVNANQNKFIKIDSNNKLIADTVDISAETSARIAGDANLQTQIDTIESRSDVVDVVANKAALDAYDTSKLTDKDVIKVLADESQSGATTYYRWNIVSGTGSFSLIGSIGPYYTKSETYTKSEVDTALSAKANQATTYTKTEVDTALGNKQDNLVFETAYDATTNKAATKADVDAREVRTTQQGFVTTTTTWEGSASPYYQIITVAGATITNNSCVDLCPDATTIQLLIDDGCSGMYIENDDQTLKLYAIGEHPTVALNMLVLVTETIPYTYTPDYLCFTANLVNSAVKLWVSGGDFSEARHFAYSTDNKVTWTEFTAEKSGEGSGDITLANIGDKVYFRGTNNVLYDETTWTNMNFVITGSVAASGNVNTLLSYTTDITNLTGRDNCFISLFQDAINLTSAPNLPATTLAPGCYSRMFESTGLTSAPTLPATTLAEGCYLNMFDYSMSLTTASALPATTLATNCYSNMFGGCSALTTVPALPATTLADGCYNGMFSYCTALEVNDATGTGHANEWKIPTAGTIAVTGTNVGSDMFTSCLGTRASDSMTGAQGLTYTYYTQNTPVQ